MNFRITAIVRKEFIHIVRDRRSLVIVFLLPVVMVLLYGYAISFDIKELKLGILDQDRTAASREFIRQLTSSNYFKVTTELQRRADIEKALLQQEAVAALVIPVNFGVTIQINPETQVQLIVDGSNSNTATIVMNYLKTFCMLYSLKQNTQILPVTLDLTPRVWYNPDMKSDDFIVPGLVAIIMMLICALLTSITIARERETGTMEQILVSPIRPAEIIFGKIAPYVLLALLDALVVVFIGTIIFAVPFRGDPLLFLIFCVTYVYASLSLGVFISARSKSQQVAMMMALLATILPSVLLSGFIFPILSMPFVLQVISYLVPAKYFLIIIRGIMLKGLGITHFYQPALFLFTFGTLLLVSSVGRFKTNLEG